MTVYHIEMKKDGDVIQFVSRDIGEKAMFKWIYNTLNNNPTGKMVIYHPTQLAGSNFKLYNEFGKASNSAKGIRFYTRFEGRSFLITPKGELVNKDAMARRA